jgi:hypothetical protein
MSIGTEIAQMGKSYNEVAPLAWEDTSGGPSTTMRIGVRAAGQAAKQIQVV